jgi:hypothetical protein
VTAADGRARGEAGDNISGSEQCRGGGKEEWYAKRAGGEGKHNWEAMGVKHGVCMLQPISLIGVAARKKTQMMLV